MALLSGSTRRPTVAIGPPSAGIHAHVVSLTKPSAQTVSAAPNASAIAPIDTRPARGPTRRSGATTARRTKVTKGSPRTSSGSQTLGAIALATEQVEAVRLDGPANAEDRDDDRQPDRDLGDRDGDGEEREDEPRHVPLKRANATRLMLTALSISSIPSSMPTALRRVKTPKRPIENTSAPRIRYAGRPIIPRSARSKGRRGGPPP